MGEFYSAHDRIRTDVSNQELRTKLTIAIGMLRFILKPDVAHSVVLQRVHTVLHRIEDE